MWLAILSHRAETHHREHREFLVRKTSDTPLAAHRPPNVRRGAALNRLDLSSVSASMVPWVAASGLLLQWGSVDRVQMNDYHYNLSCRCCMQRATARHSVRILRASLQNLAVQVWRRVRGFQVRTFVAAEFDRVVGPHVRRSRRAQCGIFSIGFHRWTNFRCP